MWKRRALLCSFIFIFCGCANSKYLLDDKIQEYDDCQKSDGSKCRENVLPLPKDEKIFLLVSIY